MYEGFFDLRERPFDLTPNPRFLVFTEPHREVLSNLEYAIASRKGLTLVIGEAGSGKTTLIRAVLERQPEQVHVVQLSNPTLSRAEFVQTLAQRFGLSPRAAESKAALLEELEAVLLARRARQEVTVLIVDEAQSTPGELLEEIRLLANMDADRENLMSVILAGQPELADRLAQPGLRQLNQRIALRCNLRALTADETARYIAGRIAAAGGVGFKIFTREAVALIHQASAGLPRTVSVLADNSLLGGFAAGMRPVQSGIVREICRDFGLLVADRADEKRPAPRQMEGSILKLNDRHESSLESSGPADTSGATTEAEQDVKPRTGWLPMWGRRRRVLGN